MLWCIVFTKGNFLRGIDNCSGAWYKKNHVGHLWFLFRKNGKKYIKKNMLYYKPFCYLIKSMLLRREDMYVNKGCNLLNPYSCMGLYMRWPLRNFYTFNHLVDSYRITISEWAVAFRQYGNFTLKLDLGRQAFLPVG